MAMMDMSAALTNPYTLSSFTVTRRVETINNSGESVITPTSLGTINGVVYPASKNDLERLPEAQRQSKSIVIISIFTFVSAAENKNGGGPAQYQPDVVVYGFDTYIVERLEDYSKYGTGFTKAICIMTDLLPGKIAGAL